MLLFSSNHQSDCEVCARISLCRAGLNDRLVLELQSGYVVLGDRQQFEGYCLLLSRIPITDLGELEPEFRETFMSDMVKLGAAIKLVTGCDRINYELLGNKDFHLHWHLFPRRSSDQMPNKPVWVQMDQLRDEFAFSTEKHGELKLKLRAALLRSNNFIDSLR